MTKTKALKNFISKFMGYDSNGNSVTSVLADATENAQGGGGANGKFVVPKDAIIYDFDVTNGTQGVKLGDAEGKEFFIWPMDVDLVENERYIIVTNDKLLNKNQETSEYKITYDYNVSQMPVATSNNLGWLNLVSGKSVHYISGSSGIWLLKNENIDYDANNFYPNSTLIGTRIMDSLKNAKSWLIWLGTSYSQNCVSKKVTIFKGWVMPEESPVSEG